MQYWPQCKQRHYSQLNCLLDVFYQCVGCVRGSRRQHQAGGGQDDRGKARPHHDPPRTRQGAPAGTRPGHDPGGRHQQPGRLQTAPGIAPGQQDDDVSTDPGQGHQRGAPQGSAESGAPASQGGSRQCASRHGSASAPRAVGPRWLGGRRRTGPRHSGPRRRQGDAGRARGGDGTVVQRHANLVSGARRAWRVSPRRQRGGMVELPPGR